MYASFEINRCSKLLIGLVIAGVLLGAQGAFAHCQVPCGIYDDAARVAALREDAKTIAKAITMMGELAGQKDVQSQNQMVRWVTTKEAHASHIIEVMSEYFFAQRVTPAAAGSEGHSAYLASLAEHHAVIVAAMKAKQNANMDVVASLEKAIDGIAKYYKHEH